MMGIRDNYKTDDAVDSDYDDDDDLFTPEKYYSPDQHAVSPKAKKRKSPTSSSGAKTGDRIADASKSFSFVPEEQQTDKFIDTTQYASVYENSSTLKQAAQAAEEAEQAAAKQHLEMEAFKAAANHFLQEVEEQRSNLSDDEEEHRGKNVFFIKHLQV